ncbi:MAG: hypothetical protein HS120_09525 [Burkholderiales bacterium]|nr:hypothetical protein [Burkholderiales bacterium]
MRVLQGAPCAPHLLLLAGARGAPYDYLRFCPPAVRSNPAAMVAKALDGHDPLGFAGHVQRLAQGTGVAQHQRPVV